MVIIFIFSYFFCDRWFKNIIFSCIEFDSIAELLIEKGADVNFAGKNGKTALMGAAEKGKTVSPNIKYFFYIFWHSNCNSFSSIENYFLMIYP